MADRSVWYVAYGSNLSATRFQRYLDRCADPTGPVEARPTTIPHELYFASASSFWGGGGTAFVDPLAGGAETLAVAWRISEEQFLHVLASENGRSVGAVAGADLPSAVGVSVPVLPGRYGLVIGVESPDRRRAFTFTSSETPRPPATFPSAEYVDTIVSGLTAHHRCTEVAARAYLARRGGSAEVGLGSDPREEVTEGLERRAVLEQDSDVAPEAEVAGDEGIEGRPQS